MPSQSSFPMNPVHVAACKLVGQMATNMLQGRPPFEGEPPPELELMVACAKQAVAIHGSWKRHDLRSARTARPSRAAAVTRLSRQHRARANHRQRRRSTVASRLKGRGKRRRGRCSGGDPDGIASDRLSQGGRS